jgi:TldD protein
MRQFTKRIIDNLKTKKVDYGDVRVIERETELIVVKNGVIEAITHTTDIGFGIRVLKDSAWGFSSSNHIKNKEADKVMKNALSIARASARVRSTNNIVLSSIQEMIYSGGSIEVFAMDKEEMQSRSYGNYNQAGYEFINALDFISNAERIRDEAVMLLSAKPCPQIETTVILDAEQMVLQTHESCGHPTELDRVLGTEASYAGTSFMTMDKLNKLQYGSEIINIVADATTPGGLGTFGWDDEGVPSQKIYLVKQGKFVGYLSSRETATIINAKSSGAMRADGWNRIPLIRMTNINLVPGTWNFEDMVADTRKGVFMTTNKSWSIDDKRLNFQFACELARKIDNGKLIEIYKNPTYTGITPQFWRNCDALGNKDTWQLFGVPNCGKGEPGQSAFVGHGTVPARFRNVQIGIAR